MKRLFRILAMTALSVSLGSCDVEYDPIVVLPNVKLDNSGLTNVSTVSIYQNDSYTVTLNRTEGLSRAAEFDIMLDETVLAEYNELNGASYTLMPASCYTVSATQIAFPEKSKTAEFSIQFKPSEIVKSAGSVAAAENYAIPFVCVPKSNINSEDKNLNAIVRFDFDEPTVTIDAGAPAEFTFISGVPVKRSLTISGRSNFTTLQTSKLAFASTQEMVDAYNTANTTAYVLLPSSCYSISQGTFDAEALSLTYDMTLDASALNPDNVYLLPLKVVSNDYTVVQDNMVYVIANIQEIKFSLLDTDRYQAATKLSHPADIEVRLNGALADDVPLVFTYDPSKIAAYNAAKGKTYKAFDASRISIPATEMKAGSVRATVAVKVDMTDVPFDNGDEYVVPLVLDKTQLPQGSIITTEDVVYVRLKRTFYGTWGNAGSNGYVSGTSGWTSNNYMRPLTMNNQTYTDFGYPYCNCYFSWSRGFHWKVAWDEIYDNDPNKRVVHAFSSVCSGYTNEQCRDNTIDYGSYFDMTEGKVWFNYQYFWNDDDKSQDKRQTIKCYLESPLTVDEF